jgi:hypothetical protein
MYNVDVAVCSEINTEHMTAMSVQCRVYQILYQMLSKVPARL